MSDLQATYHINDVMSVATTTDGSGVISFITNNNESFIQSGESITSGSGNKLNFTKINDLSNSLLTLDLSNGRIGIGNKNPDRPLDVYGNAIIRGDISANGNVIIRGIADASDNRNVLILDPGVNIRDLRKRDTEGILMLDACGNTIRESINRKFQKSIVWKDSTNPFYNNYFNSDVAKIVAEYNGSTFDINSGNHALSFHTYDGWQGTDKGEIAERMRISGDKDVAMVNINGTLDVRGLDVRGSTNTIRMNPTDGARGIIESVLPTNNNTKLPLCLNPVRGNVGIGTTDPQTRLDVNGTFSVINDAELKPFTSSNKQYLYVDTSLSNNLRLGGYDSLNNRSIPLCLQTGRGDISVGNVGIGTTIPQAQLDVNGNAIIRGDISANGKLSVNGDISANGKLTVSGKLEVSSISSNGMIEVGGNLIMYEDIEAYTNAIIHGDIYANGKLNVGGDISANGKLYVSGNVGIGKASSTHKLDVSGNTNIRGDISADGKLDVSGTTNITGTTSIIGNVGIGKTSSTHKLDVSGNTIIRGELDVSNNAIIRGDISANGKLNVGGNTIIRGDISANGKLSVNGDISANGKLTVSGNVGIGTINPQARLDVDGTTNIRGGLDVSGTTNIKAKHINIETNEPGTGASFISFKKSDNNTASNIGSELGVIDFNGTLNGTSYLRSAMIIAYQDGAANSQIPGRLEFHTSTANNENSSKMVIKNDGKVGIGTIDPKERLDVNGTVRASSTTTAIVMNPNNGAYGIIESFSATTLHNKLPVCLNPFGGNVGIGTTDPTERLDVNGNLKLSGDISANGNIHTNGTYRIGDGAYLGLVNGINTLWSNNYDLLINSQNKNITFKNEGGAGGPKDIMLIANTGNVGIGTTDPQARLDVDGTTNIRGGLDVSGTTTIKAKHINIETNEPGTGASFISFKKSDNNTASNIGSELGVIDFNGTLNGTSYLRSAMIIAYQDGAANSQIPGRLEFHTSTANNSNSSKMVIKNNGNVGIGTLDPQARLDVDGTVRASSTTTAIVMNPNNGAYGIIESFSATTLHNKLPVCLNPFGGNVGIGTTDPTERLDVNGNLKLSGDISANGNIRTNGTYRIGVGAYLGLEKGINTLWSNNYDLLINSQNKNITFRNQGGAGGSRDIMLIANTGNVGIGTTDPQARLDVDGTTNIRGGLDVSGTTTIKAKHINIETNEPGTGASFISFKKSDNNTASNIGSELGVIDFNGTLNGTSYLRSAMIIAYQDGAANSQIPGRLEFHTSTANNENSSKMVIKNDGKVGIGTLDPQARLDVDGDLTVRGNINMINGNITTILEKRFFTLPAYNNNVSTEGVPYLSNILTTNDNDRISIKNYTSPNVKTYIVPGNNTDTYYIELIAIGGGGGGGATVGNVTSGGGGGSGTRLTHRMHIPGGSMLIMKIGLGGDGPTNGESEGFRNGTSGPLKRDGEDGTPTEIQIITDIYNTDPYLKYTDYIDQNGDNLKNKTSPPTTDQQSFYKIIADGGKGGKKGFSDNKGGDGGNGGRPVKNGGGYIHESYGGGAGSNNGNMNSAGNAITENGYQNSSIDDRGGGNGGGWNAGISGFSLGGGGGGYGGGIPYKGLRGGNARYYGAGGAGGSADLNATTFNSFIIGGGFGGNGAVIITKVEKVDTHPPHDA